MIRHWTRDIWFQPGDPLFELRKIARSHKLTAKQKGYLRKKLLKDKIRFRLFGPLY